MTANPAFASFTTLAGSPPTWPAPHTAPPVATPPAPTALPGAAHGCSAAGSSAAALTASSALAAAAATTAARRRRWHSHACGGSRVAAVVAVRSEDEASAQALMEETVKKQAETAESIESLVGVLQGLVVSKASRVGSSGEKLQAEMADLKRQVTELQGAYEQAADELEMTQVQMEYQRLSAPNADAMSEQLKTKLQEVSEDRGKLLEQRRMIQMEVKKLIDKVVAADGEKEQLLEVSSAKESLIGVLQGQVASLRNEQEKLQGKMTSAKATMDELDGSLAAAEEEKTSLLRLLCTVEKEKLELEEKMSTMAEQQTLLEDDLSAAKSREVDTAALLRQQDVFKAEVEQLTGRFAEVSSEKAELSEKLDLAEKVVRELQARLPEMESLRNEVKRVLGESREWENRAVKAEQQVSSMQKEVKELTERYVAVSGERDKFSKELDAREDIVGELKKRVAATESLMFNLDTLKEQKSQLERKADEAERTGTTLGAACFLLLVVSLALMKT